MPKGFRPLLEPPSHRRGDLARRPCLCVIVTLGVTLLVFAMFGMSAWNVFAHRFDQNKQHFHPGDEVSLTQVSDDLSSTFCDQYKVSLWTTGKAYLLPHSAQVNTTIVDSTPVFMHQLPSREYNVKTFYLLRNSMVDVTACREMGSRREFAEIVLIMGYSNFQAWREKSDCSSCKINHTVIPFDAFCNSNFNSKERVQLTHVVDRNDNYYLVIFYGRPYHHKSWERETGIFLNGSIGHTHFNITGYEKECHINDSLSCTFSLPWNSNKDIVVRLDTNYQDRDAPSTLITTCHIRKAFWVCLFGLLPVICIIPISLVFGYYLCRRTRRNFDAVQRYGSTMSRQHRKERRATEATASRPEEVVLGEDNGSMAIQFG